MEIKYTYNSKENGILNPHVPIISLTQAILISAIVLLTLPILLHYIKAISRCLIILHCQHFSIYNYIISIYNLLKNRYFPVSIQILPNFGVVFQFGQIQGPQIVTSQQFKFLLIYRFPLPPKESDILFSVFLVNWQLDLEPLLNSDLMFWQEHFIDSIVQFHQEALMPDCFSFCDISSH